MISVSLVIINDLLNPEALRVQFCYRYLYRIIRIDRADNSGETQLPSYKLLIQVHQVPPMNCHLNRVEGFCLPANLDPCDPGAIAPARVFKRQIAVREGARLRANQKTLYELANKELEHLASNKETGAPFCSQT